MKKFASEAELCADFIAWVKASAGTFSLGIKTPTWTAYPETAGWDILLVGEDGTQIGLQAKMRFNLKVLDQALPGGWESWHEEGPDYRALLVPDADSMADNLCAALGLGLFRQSAYGYGRGFAETQFRPGLSLENHNGGWHFWNPARRHKLPAFVPDVVAGASGPVQLTKWKVAALRIVARLELAGFVTKQDFREIGIDPRRWVGPAGWLRAGVTAGQFVDDGTARFKEQHPCVYPQVLAAEREVIEARQGLLRNPSEAHAP